MDWDYQSGVSAVLAQVQTEDKKLVDWAPSRKSVGDPFEQQSETVPSSEGTARGRKAPTLDLSSRAASGDDSSPRCEDSTHPFGQNGTHL